MNTPNEAHIPMFVDDLNDALRATINALGGMKMVGAELKPELSAIDAGKWLADCVNPEKRTRLAPDQLAYVRRKARAAGIHILAAFEMRDAGYQPPVPVEPEDERAALQREFIEMGKRMEALLSQMQRTN